MRVWAADQWLRCGPGLVAGLRALSPAVGTACFALLTWAAAKGERSASLHAGPGTLQTLPVLLAGALLGARAGAASQMAYLAMGIAGLPVIALPGSGPAYLARADRRLSGRFHRRRIVTGRVRHGAAGSVSPGRSRRSSPEVRCSTSAA